MYWLIGILIIVVMIATLAVTDGVVLPIEALSINVADVPIWLLLLIITSILLGLVSQRSLLSPASLNNDQLVPQHISFILRLSVHTAHYLLLALLITVLLISSVLQALTSHQRAEKTEISNSMRVQALVTIEGISDSVYDSLTNSGYRQVAIIDYILPLVADLSARELDAFNIEALTQFKEDSSSYDLNTDNVNDDYHQRSQHRILLNAYPNNPSKDNKLATVNALQPGDQLLMTMTLAPLATSQQAINNPTGFDSYRWLRGRHIDGIGNIIAVSTPVGNITQPSALIITEPTSVLKRLRTHIDQRRWQLRQHFYQDWATQTSAQQQANAVTLSLLTGDRSLIDRDTKDLYQLAGISHLLAISGTHVLFLAIMLAGLATVIFDQFWPVLYRYIPRWQVRWLVMISAAFIYALFTGFDVPAARTAWMLLAIGAVRFTLLPISTMRVLLALAVLMAWVDPYVLWQAGYWLSFIAVALLLKYDAALQAQDDNNLTNKRQSQHQQNHSLWHIKVWSLFKRVVKLQCWLFIALLPITLLLFGKASLWGLLINLFAIGLFGWILVPLNLLAGLCYLIIPSIADGLWALVGAIVGNLHALIIWLTTLPALNSAWLYTPVNTGILLIALLVLLPWLLPRGLLSRWLALPPLTLLTLTVYANQQALTLTPTLYILPTNDRYLSAAVLQYPVTNHKLNDSNTFSNDSVSWLFLADHRPADIATKPSSLTADKLSATLEQQLRSLSINRLEGIVVQTSVVTVTDTSPSSVQKSKTNKNDARNNTDKKATLELLPMTVAQLSQKLPTSQYWQAGWYEHGSALNQNYAMADSVNNSDNSKTLITAQSCEQGKTWQSPNSDLKLQALTGWSKINDASVWDCTLAIDSSLPIQVVQYNAANPLKSPQLLSQTLTENPSFNNQQDKAISNNQSRIVLDAATYQRVWQLWSLLCGDDTVLDGHTGNNAITWLGHSGSKISSEALKAQGVNEIMTYNGESLEAAFTLNAAP